jgi:hypothetical protein
MSPSNALRIAAVSFAPGMTCPRSMSLSRLRAILARRLTRVPVIPAATRRDLISAPVMVDLPKKIIREAGLLGHLSQIDQSTENVACL